MIRCNGSGADSAEQDRRADAICIRCRAMRLRSPLDAAPGGMAIAFARARYISREPAAARCARRRTTNARRSRRSARGALLTSAHRDAPEHHEVLLPDGREPSPRARRRAVERGGGGGAAQGRAGGARDRAGAAGERGADRRGPGRAGAVVRRSSTSCRTGLAVQLDVHAPHVRRHASRAGELARASADHDAAGRRGGVRGEEGARSRSGGAAGRRAGGGERTARPGASCGAITRTGTLRSRARRSGWRRRARVPQEHIGPVRMRGAGSEANRSAERSGARRTRRRRATRRQVLAALTRNNATFSERDLDRHLGEAHCRSRRARRP